MESKIKLHPYYALVAIVLTVAVFYVSLLPKQEIPEVNLLQVDKLVHFTLYFLLTVIYFFGFFRTKNNSLWQKLTPALVAISIGLIVEFLQHFATSTRFFDVFDIFANALGAFFGFYLLKKLSLTS